MNYADTLKYSIAVFPTLYKSRAAVLNQLFCVNGSGYSWNEDGQIQARGDDGDNRLNELVAIERYIGAGKHKEPAEDTDCIPEELFERRILSTGNQIPADIEERLASTEYTHWYPMSMEYNSLTKLPDNTPTDWLNAAYECATLIVNTPLDADLEDTVAYTAGQFRDVPVFDKKGYKVIGREKNSPEVALEKARKHVIEERQRIYSIAAFALDKMKTQFPNHTFEINPVPTFDANRPFDKKGITPWPMDDAPADFDLCIGPFRKALKFAYSMRRKNQKKDIPYQGLPLGHDERVCSIGPEERFTAESLAYDKDDQGRDAIEVILCCMAQINIEQGRRIALKKVREELNRYFQHEKFEVEHREYIAGLREKAKSDPKVAAQVRILDRIEAQKKTDKYARISGKIPYNADDPLEVEVAEEMHAAQRKMSQEILAMLDNQTKTAGAGEEDE